MSLEDLKSIVSQLPAEELERFSRWFEEFLADQFGPDFGLASPDGSSSAIPPHMLLNEPRADLIITFCAVFRTDFLICGGQAARVPGGTTLRVVSWT